MKYLALLRGVNVGGNSLIKMSALKDAFIKAGLTHVATYINSGNVLFDSHVTQIEPLTKKIEEILQKTFFPIKIILVSQHELQNVLQHMPQSWKHEDLRKYIAFIRSPSKPEDVIQEVQLKDGIDFIEKGSGVVYLSTKMSGLTKSGFPKLITKKVYKDITIRNYNTVEKLFHLMGEDKSKILSKEV